MKIYIFYLLLSDHNVCGQGSRGFYKLTASTKDHVRRIGSRFTENVKAMSHSLHSGIVVKLWKTVLLFTIRSFIGSYRSFFFSIQGIDFLECFRKNLHQLFLVLIFALTIFISKPPKYLSISLHVIIVINTSCFCKWIRHYIVSYPPRPPPLPLKLRGGVSCFGNLDKEGDHEKLLRNRGLVERGELLEKGRFPYCFISCPSEKNIFITIWFFLSGKYSHLL